MPIASLGDTALAAVAGNRHRISQDPAQPRPRFNNCWKAWTCLLKAVAAQDVAQVKLGGRDLHLGEDLSDDDPEEVLIH